MATPVFGARTSGTADNATSISPTMPTASAGDLLLVIASCGANGTLTTTSSGWTRIVFVNNGSLASMAVFVGKQGTAGSLTINSTAGNGKVWFAESYSGTASSPTDVEAATATGTADFYDPPNLAPSHGSQDYMWVAAAIGPDEGEAPSSAPSGWGGFQAIEAGGFGTSTTALGIARLAATGSSMDPPGFGKSGFGDGPYAAVTIAIPPELSAPVAFNPDSVTATEGVPSVAFSGATDSIAATEGTAGVSANIPGGVATDTATTTEGTATIAASGAVDDAAAAENSALLTVGATDTAAVIEDNPGIAFSGAADTIGALEDALVTQTAEVDPDTVTVAEGLAEVIPLHEVADQVLTQEDALVTTTITAEDSFGITESTGPFDFSVSDSFGWSEYAFNFGDGLEIRHPRKHRVERATRGHSISSDYRTHQIERAARVHTVA